MEDINSWHTKFEPCQYSDRLLNKLTLLNKTAQNPVDIQEVKKAIYYARKYHGSQTRKSGEPYYSHPLEVAYMISDYLFKTDVIVASILHDIVEDTEITVGMIVDLFGWRVAKMVDRLTRDRPDGSKLSVEEILNNAYEKEDKEVILIKIIDRLHNIETIHFKSEESRKRIVLETWKNFLVASASINVNLEKELNFYIYKVLPLPQGINSAQELYTLSELKEESILAPLAFENDRKQI